MARGISEGASKKNLVVFLFDDVFGHSFFFFFFLTCNVFVTTSIYMLVHVCAHPAIVALQVVCGNGFTVRQII